MPTAKKTTKTKKACCNKKGCVCAKDTNFKTGLIVVLACIAGLLAWGTFMMVGNK